MKKTNYSDSYAAPRMAVHELASKQAVCITSPYRLPEVVEEEYDF